MITALTPLSGLSAANFTHPADRAVLAKVRAIPLLDGLVGQLVDLHKREIELGLIASAIHATPALTPRLHGIYRDVSHALDFGDGEPPLYIEQNPVINAYTMGADQPYVCITSGAIEQLEEDELRFVLGHELGHVLAQHVRYQTLTQVLLRISRSSGLISGIAGLAVDATALPLLMLWSRRAEFTADRGGLLACQDVDAAFRAFLKMGGFPARTEARVDSSAFLQQLEEFEHCVGSSVIDQVFSLTQQLTASHPRGIERAAELKLWIDDGSYTELVEADEATRRGMACQTNSDPGYAELLSVVARVLRRWCVDELRVPPQEAARLARRALSGGATLRDTPLEKLLRVELTAEPQGARQVTYWLVLLHTRDGQPARTKLVLPFDPDRDYAPDVVRRELSRAAGGPASWQLYSV